MTDEFLADIETNIQAASKEAALIHISIARPEPAPNAFFCDQNPFETAHVLANGDVVVCEVLDRRPMGSLAHSSLTSIWNSAAYENFRQSYLADAVEECRTCVFRTRSEKVGPLRTLWGWYNRDERARCGRAPTRDSRVKETDAASFPCKERYRPPIARARKTR